MQLTRQSRSILGALAVVGTLGAAVALAAATDMTTSSSMSTPGQPDSTISDATTASESTPTVIDAAVDPPDRRSGVLGEEPGNDVTADTLAIDASGGVDGEAGEFVDTEPIEGTPGVITGNADVPTGRPPLPPPTMQVAQLVAVAKPAPAPTTPPAVDPIDILEVGEGGPVAPAIVVTNFQVPVDNSIGDFATPEQGCALACVTKAVLTPAATSSNVSLDVEAAVPARIDITLTKTADGHKTYATSNTFKTKWSTTLELAPATEYELMLEAFDEDGQRRIHTHTFTTRTPVQKPNQFQDEQTGCAGTCITQATVTPTDRHDEVRFDIKTNTPASVKVWMSASAPGWIDDVPVLPADTVVEPTLGIRTDFSVEKAFLDDNTTYHVVVRAEDDYGIDYQVGEFHTGPPPPVNVLLTFEQIYVQWDGDPHWGGLDRGELSFAWGLQDGALGAVWEDGIGSRSEEKMDGGTTVVLGGYGSEYWQTLDSGDMFLMPGVTVMERDNPPGVEFLRPVVRLRDRPFDGYYHTMNPAWGPRLTLDEITSQQTCGEMGVVTAAADDYCVRFDSMKQDDDDFARIQVIVSYHLDT